MKTKAVIDRFEGDYAVLILKESNQCLNAPRKSLPSKSKEGSWLVVELDGEKIVGAELDEQETEEARKRIATKFERLKKGDHLKK